MVRNSEYSPSNDESQEEIKSPEELRFEALVKDAGGRGLEGNYAWVRTEEDAKMENEDSMRVAYEKSGDAEKLSMLELQEIRHDVNMLAAAFLVKRKEYMDECILKTEPMLSKLDIEMPKTFEEANKLGKKIVTFENWQKLTKDIIGRN